MGTHFFQKPKQFQSSGQNLQARAISAPGYAAKAAGGAAQKDIAAASAVYSNARLKPTSKDVVADVRGPKV